MSKDTQNMALDMSGSDITMEVVLKNIYTSCDPNNLNSVPTSELIEFIRPYMLEDLSALDNLKRMLDPENTNIPVPGEKFYNVMNEWTQKIASHTDKDDGLFNETPR
uniref:Uncharacterized protein LOC114337071 n=1 Tax=Diabrotica virgifera virgifera TaxID=50390 RepID=A0A6P7GE86_DIAVI